jgi:hypothetical protein
MRSHISFAAILVSASMLAVPVSAQDKLGVDICDDFLTKYEACSAKMPSAQRDQVKAGMEQMRNSWKPMTANPQSKAALEGVCKQMGDTMKASMASYGCQW